MDFSVPEEIERLCDGVRRFMDEHVYPLEHIARAWKLEAGGPVYPPVIRDVQRRAKALGYWAFHLPAEAGGIPFMSCAVAAGRDPAPFADSAKISLARIPFPSTQEEGRVGPVSKIRTRSAWDVAPIFARSPFICARAVWRLVPRRFAISSIRAPWRLRSAT
jgi:hypothetical protein